MIVLPLIVMGALLVIGGFASLFLPETRGKNLPQTIEDGEAVPLNFFKCCCNATNKKPTISPESYPKEQVKPRRVICSICKNEIKNLH